MIRRPPQYPLTHSLFPDTTLFRARARCSAGDPEPGQPRQQRQPAQADRRDHRRRPPAVAGPGRARAAAGRRARHRGRTDRRRGPLRRLRRLPAGARARPVLRAVLHRQLLHAPERAQQAARTAAGQLCAAQRCAAPGVAMNTEPLPPGPDDDDANAATLPPSLAPRAAIDALMAQPERYGFFQAARLLFRTHGLTDLRAGGREAVRLGVLDSLSFPPGEITALQPAPEQVYAELRMTVAFLGLTGPKIGRAHV